MRLYQTPAREGSSSLRLLFHLVTQKYNIISYNCCCLSSYIVFIHIYLPPHLKYAFHSFKNKGHICHQPIFFYHTYCIGIHHTLHTKQSSDMNVCKTTSLRNSSYQPLKSLFLFVICFFIERHEHILLFLSFMQSRAFISPNIQSNSGTTHSRK